MYVKSLSEIDYSKTEGTLVFIISSFNSKCNKKVNCNESKQIVENKNNTNMSFIQYINKNFSDKITVYVIDYKNINPNMKENLPIFPIIKYYIKGNLFCQFHNFNRSYITKIINKTQNIKMV